ncbi:serine/threonine-protein kinase [Nonomuraea muscovyensis]|uniref:serine/threonine-protein kinase n=1 Tax=Nonomuraea muscovyensis TaxID=1124761 RepID=UPI0034020854
MTGDRIVGGYVLRRVLGRGGMGVVHLASTPTGGLAAVKVIHPELARDPAFQRRFEREVTAARRVARFCTAPMLDAGIDGDTAYLVTEYVKGPDLAQAVREQGPLSGSNLDALAVGIATALSAIHSAGVIHRDLKPSNVLLSPLGPRVIDFGIAQLVDAGPGSQVSQAILGTPAFMAPEQVRGEPLGPAADVYAWGGVLAFAGTGRLPFGGGAPAEVLYRIVNEGPSLDGLDENMRDLVERAMAKDPRLRPTAERLLAALVGGGALTPARATEVVERTWTGPVIRGGAGPQTRTGAPGTDPAPGAATTGGRGVLAGGPEAAAGGAPGAGAGGAAGAAMGGAPGAGAGGAPGGGGRRRAGRWVVWAVGVVAVLVAAAVGGVLVLEPESGPYRADFTDGWEVGTSRAGTARAEGTAYVLTVEPGWRLWKSAPRREPGGAVVVSAEVRPERGAGEYGVWCHGASGGGRYEFVLSSANEAAIVKRAAGRRPVVLGGPAPARIADPGRVVAECRRDAKGATLRMWLNEALIAEATDTDDPLGPGEAGVHAAPAGRQSLRVRFESFDLKPVGG